MQHQLLPAVIIAGCFIAASCDSILPDAPNENQVLDGPISGLSNEHKKRFLAGDIAFNDEVFTSSSGLGPLFVATSCGSCHAGDGKGTLFSTLTRFGQKDTSGNKYLHLGGPQLQNRALPGFLPEKIPYGATFSKFTPPANTGLGYLELVSDQDILSMADPEDSDGDGVSGVPSYGTLPAYVPAAINAIAKEGKYIHRFGKKAAAYNLLHQTVNAYSQDIGISSFFAPKDIYHGQDIDPEIASQVIYDVVFYLQTLKAPAARAQNDPDVLSGKQTFIGIGCQGCHRQSLMTGYSEIPALSRQTFHPYTDLLLHDMGPGLDDGYTEGSAKSSEWRTPPLWGLGLSPRSQGDKYFLMHDGRATGIRQAILMHGGEASRSKSSFEKLTVAQQDQIIKFLESL